MNGEENTMESNERKAIIEEFLALFGRGRFDDPANAVDFEAILARMTDDVEWWIAGRPGSGLLTKDEFRSSGNIFAEISDGELEIIPVAWTMQGDRVAVEAYSKMPLKSGALYNNHYHFLFEFRGDKLCVFKEYFDTEHVRDAVATGRARVAN
jgi:ketosteroid isomerase-like protein